MRKIFLLFFGLGFFSLLSQTIIVRECIISFTGNELSLGLFFSFWLFWVGVGALITATFLGKLLYRRFLYILFLYPLCAFIEFFLFVTLRELAPLAWWEFFSLERASGYLFFELY